MAGSWLRASPATTQRSATTFEALPPFTTPMFAVVSSSMRPSRIAPMARAAATMALRPLSGAMPACAATPWNSAVTRFCVGEATMSVPGAPSLSSTNTRRAVRPLRSSALAPSRPASSPAVKTSSTSPAGGSATSARASTSRTATAALSSAPSTVAPSLRTNPSSTTTRGAPETGTVSRWAHRARGSASPLPATRATRLPQPQPVTGALPSSWTPRPRPPRCAATASATSRSAPVGDAMPQSRTKRSTSSASTPARTRPPARRRARCAGGRRHPRSRGRAAPAAWAAT